MLHFKNNERCMQSSSRLCGRCAIVQSAFSETASKGANCLTVDVTV